MSQKESPMDVSEAAIAMCSGRKRKVFQVDSDESTNINMKEDELTAKLQNTADGTALTGEDTDEKGQNNLEELFAMPQGTSESSASPGMDEDSFEINRNISDLSSSENHVEELAFARGNDESTRGEDRSDNSPAVQVDYKCSICTDSSNYKKMKTLSCSHKFHQVCINNWLRSRKECPVCRKEINPPGNTSHPPNNHRPKRVKIVNTCIMGNCVLSGVESIRINCVTLHPPNNHRPKRVKIVNTCIMGNCVLSGVEKASESTAST